MTENNKQLAVLSSISSITNQIVALYTPLNVIETLSKKDSNTIVIEVKDNPTIEDLQMLLKDEKHCFNFNNKPKSVYIECHKDDDYYIEYYKTFGKPQLYGLYETNNHTKMSKLIGSISLINRYDTKVCQIMDLKILKKYRGTGGVSKFIMSTFFSRLFKYNGYYGICMNNNTIIEKLTYKLMIPSMSNRGNMLIYLVSFDEITKILPILTAFYCSTIGFINNKKSRMFVDTITKKDYKILHLHHNAEYREVIDYHEPQKEKVKEKEKQNQNHYLYCFSIHESSEFIIKDLKDKYKIESSSSATIYSNYFITDWSKFVKTYEI